VVANLRKCLGRLQERLFILLAKNAANPTDFHQIPPGRVLEMGAQVSVWRAAVLRSRTDRRIAPAVTALGSTRAPRSRA
jgi:hypothetical protein